MGGVGLPGGHCGPTGVQGKRLRVLPAAGAGWGEQRESRTGPAHTHSKKERCWHGGVSWDPDLERVGHEVLDKSHRTGQGAGESMASQTGVCGGQRVREAGALGVNVPSPQGK